ncbi:transposase [Alkalihalobacterium alkalinitrilicum]|uniref:transposase n=1 Tax=Alkalihalobacterium alkalinitrilicum TaxID=427920 RepID=UPI000995319E
MLEKIYEKIPYELVAYCFMTNHFHLQLRSKEASISKVMALLNKRYANYYNTKYRLTGHVLEKRFFSEVIEDATGMLEVARYIFLNPVKARMVRFPGHYPWSSFQLYTNSNILPPLYMDTERLLNYFPGPAEEKRRQIVDFVKSAIRF